MIGRIIVRDDASCGGVDGVQIPAPKVDGVDVWTGQRVLPGVVLKHGLLAQAEAYRAFALLHGHAARRRRLRRFEGVRFRLPGVESIQDEPGGAVFIELKGEDRTVAVLQPKRGAVEPFRQGKGGDRMAPVIGAGFYAEGVGRRLGTGRQDSGYRMSSGIRIASS